MWLEQLWISFFKLSSCGVLNVDVGRSVDVISDLKLTLTYLKLESENCERSKVLKQTILCCLFGFNPHSKSRSCFGQSGGGENEKLDRLSMSMAIYQ